MRAPARAPSALMVMAATLAATACGPEEAAETTELLATGNRIELRDTLRPQAGPPRVLVFALDGVGYDAFRQALELGHMPRLAALAGPLDGAGPPGHGFLAPPMTTVLPSITMAAWTTLFTGEPPARTGVPGNEWFDRRVGEFRAPAPVSVTGKSHALKALSEGLLGTWINVPTLYERADVRSYVSMQQVHRGADLLTVASAEDLGKVLGAFATGVGTDEPVDRELYEAVDRASADGAAGAVRERGAPDLQVVYFPGVDLYTHVAGAPLADQQSYLHEVVDPAVGDVLDAWRDAGALEGTWILVVADHGHTPVPSDERHALRADGPVSPAAVLEAEGWRVRPPQLDAAEDADHQAVLALQGAFAYVYLADRDSCPAPGDPCPWDRAPDPAEVDSVAAAFHRAGEGAGSALPDSARMPGAIEMVLVPERDSTGALRGIRRWTDDGPVPLASAPGDTALLALEDRLLDLLDGPRGYLAGDVILMARSGGWVEPDRRFYFSHPYHSWHGSAHPSDSRVPLLVIRPDLSGDEVAERVRSLLPAEPTQADFTRLVLDLLEGGG